MATPTRSPRSGNLPIHLFERYAIRSASLPPGAILALPSPPAPSPSLSFGRLSSAARAAAVKLSASSLSSAPSVAPATARTPFPPSSSATPTTVAPFGFIAASDARYAFAELADAFRAALQRQAAAHERETERLRSEIRRLRDAPPENGRPSSTGVHSAAAGSAFPAEPVAGRTGGAAGGHSIEALAAQFGRIADRHRVALAAKDAALAASAARSTELDAAATAASSAAMAASAKDGTGAAMDVDGRDGRTGASSVLWRLLDEATERVENLLLAAPQHQQSTVPSAAGGAVLQPAVQRGGPTAAVFGGAGSGGARRKMSLFSFNAATIRAIHRGILPTEPTSVAADDVATADADSVARGGESAFPETEEDVPFTGWQVPTTAGAAVFAGMAGRDANEKTDLSAQRGVDMATQTARASVRRSRVRGSDVSGDPAASATDTTADANAGAADDNNGNGENAPLVAECACQTDVVGGSFRVRPPTTETGSQMDALRFQMWRMSLLDEGLTTASGRAPTPQQPSLAPRPPLAASGSGLVTPPPLATVSAPSRAAAQLPDLPPRVGGNESPALGAASSGGSIPSVLRLSGESHISDRDAATSHASPTLFPQPLCGSMVTSDTFPAAVAPLSPSASGGHRASLALSIDSSESCAGSILGMAAVAGVAAVAGRAKARSIVRGRRATLAAPQAAATSDGECQVALGPETYPRLAALDETRVRLARATAQVFAALRGTAENLAMFQAGYSADLICGHCGAQFARPVLLVACGHTFCEQCVETAMKSEDPTGGDVYRCSDCTRSSFEGHTRNSTVEAVLARWNFHAVRSTADPASAVADLSSLLMLLARDDDAVSSITARIPGVR